MTISVTPDRLLELKQEIQSWKRKTYTTRKEMESIIGKLQFVCNCIRSGRLFLNRLLNFLRTMTRHRKYVLPQQAVKDVLWWEAALQQFPGTSLMWCEQFDEPDTILATDSSLKGAGGTCGLKYFRTAYPDFVRCNATIAHLELMALIIGIKVFLPQLKGKRLVVHCDNQAVAELINSGRAKDLQLQAGLREVCYLAAVGEFELYARFLPGVQNRIPDLLSRWDMGQKYRDEFRRLAPHLVRTSVRHSMFYHTHPW